MDPRSAPLTLAEMLEAAASDEILAESASAARAADLEADGGASTEGAAPGGQPSARRISRMAVDLIVAFEVTSRTVYERRYRVPIWPGGASGVTIGIGYDLAFADAARFRDEWSDVLDERRLGRLETACGVGGPLAGSVAASLGDTLVEWDEAEAVFRDRTLPLFTGATERALPNTDRLNGDCLGALVSLVYNRGPSFGRDGDRFREMRAIKEHMQRGDLARIPNEIRAMRRIWNGLPGMAGLLRRREVEAALFEQGLSRGAVPEATAVVTEGPLSGARDFVAGLFAAPTKDLVFAPLERPEAPPTVIKVDEAYVSIRVLSARVTHSRRWTSAFHAAVHARADMIYEGGTGRVEREVVLAPDGFRDLDPKGEGKLLQMDRPLFGPMPYRGDLRLSLALFSVKSVDLAGPYLSLLGKIAETGALGFLSAAQPFVAPLRQATDLLFGTADAAALECGVVRGFDTLRTGTFACLGATRAEVPDAAVLRLHPDDLRLPWPDGRAMTEYPYVVFSVERSATRDDWMSIPDLRDAWEALRADMSGGGDGTTALLEAFRRCALASPDLLGTDARRLVRRAEARFGAGGAATEAAAFADLDLYDVRD